MDIAADRDIALGVEDDTAFLLAAVEFQLEGIVAREGIDVVPDPVAIGEDHFGPLRHDQDKGIKLEVFLGHFMDHVRRRSGQGARQADHGMGNGLSGRRGDPDGHVFGGGLTGHKQRGQKAKQTHHNPNRAERS